MINPIKLRQRLGKGPSDAQLGRYSELKGICDHDVPRGHLTLMPGMRAMLDRLNVAGVLPIIGPRGARGRFEGCDAAVPLHRPGVPPATL